MTLIVETGAGLPDSDSYVSLAAATARHASLGNAAWAALATDDLREIALRNSTVYMLATYRTRWKGQRVLATQSLDWPRSGVQVDGFSVDSDIVPTDVANACADLALRAAAGTLTVDVGRLKSRVKVGPIETEYVQGSSAQTRYTAVDNLLSAFLKGGGGQIPVVRC